MYHGRSCRRQGAGSNNGSNTMGRPKCLSVRSQCLFPPSIIILIGNTTKFALIWLLHSHPSSSVWFIKIRSNFTLHELVSRTDCMLGEEHLASNPRSASMADGWIDREGVFITFAIKLTTELSVLTASMRLAEYHYLECSLKFRGAEVT